MRSEALRTAFIGLVPASLLLLHGARVQAADAGAARVQLQQGYVLKQAGNCKDAIRYFVESIRLDRQPKALIHLADCERDTGKYIAAEEHLVAARDVGRELGLSGFVSLAEARLADLETHLPRLTLRLAADAPKESVVTRDGVVLAALSLGIALPVDPGAHEVRVRGAGLERRYTLELRDSESKELQVTSLGGQPAGEPAAPSAPRTLPAPISPSPVEASNEAPSTAHSAQKTLGFVAAGAGALGLALGTFLGLKAHSKNQDAAALCTVAEPCTNDGAAHYQETIRDAKSARTGSIVAFATGGALFAVGGILLFTASPARRQGFWLAPGVAGNTLGATAEGVW